MPLCHLVEACFQCFHFQTSAPWDRPRNIVGSVSRYQLIEKPEPLLGVGCGKNKDFLLVHGIVFCWLVSHPSNQKRFGCAPSLLIGIRVAVYTILRLWSVLPSFSIENS